MQGTDILLAIGSGIIIGAVAYGAYKVLQQQKSVDLNSTNIIGHDTEGSVPPASTIDTPEPESDFSVTKQDMVSSVYGRHVKASQTVSESIDNILKRDETHEVVITENSETLSQMNNDLNDLLK